MIMSEFERFIDTDKVGEFCDVLKRSNAKFKGYYQRVLWDGEVEKGFIVNVDTKEDNNPIRRSRDYFIATEKIGDTMRVGRMEILANEVLHDLAITDMVEGRGNTLADTILMSSLASSEGFELINADTNFYDFVKCFCK